MKWRLSKPLFRFFLLVGISFFSYLNAYAVINDSDLGTLQTESSRYQITGDMLKRYEQTLKDAGIPLEAIANVTRTQLTGEPVDGVQPLPTEVVTVSSIKPEMVATSNAMVNQYSNVILPPIFNKWKTEHGTDSDIDLRNPEHTALSDSTTGFVPYLRPFLSSSDVTKKAYALMIVPQAAQRDTELVTLLAGRGAGSVITDPNSGYDAGDQIGQNADHQGISDGAVSVRSGEDSQDCSFSLAPGGKSFSFSNCAQYILTWFIKTFLLSFAGIFTWFFGTLLHYSIVIGVLDFAGGGVVGSQGVGGIGGTALYPLWQTVRDVVNLVVVFFGLGLVIMYLINKGDDIKKFVPWVIIYALFVNFSWSITRILVDYANIITLKIYSVAVPGALDPGSSTSVGSMIMNALGMQSLYQQVTGTGITTSDLVSQIKSPAVALLLVVVAFYAAYLFLVAALIFIFRAVLLIMFIVGSPFLMLDTVLPFVGDYAKKARSMFFNQLVVGVVFMLFLFITFQIMGVIKQNTTSSSTDPASLQFFGIVMILILLTIMLRVTKKLSGEVAGYINKAAGFGVGLALGGTAMVGRATLGRAAVAARDSEFLRNNQHTVLGRSASNLSNSLSQSSYDFRKFKPVSSIAQSGGIALGTINDTNYEKSLALRDKDRKERYDRIQDRYTEDVYDKKTGELLHRKGDVNEAGAQAAGNFMKSLNKNTALLDKGGLRKTLSEDDAKRAEGVKKEQESLTEKLLKEMDTNPETGKPYSKAEKQKNYEELKKQLDEVKKTDPNLAGNQAQAIVAAIKKADDKKASEAADFTKQVEKAFKEYQTYDQAKQATFLAQQSDEVASALKEKIGASTAPVVSRIVDANGKPFDLSAAIRNAKTGGTPPTPPAAPSTSNTTPKPASPSSGQAAQAAQTAIQNAQASAAQSSTATV